MQRSQYSLIIIAIAISAIVAVRGASVYAQAAKPTMTAKLVDPEKKAADRAATVEVTTSGIELIDPAKAGEKSMAGQGHLHYQLDNGPVIATPTPKLSFHELAPGSHTIVVMLAGNDHKALGPQEKLTLTVPKKGADTGKSGY